jgi:hypothetical protein
MPEIPHVKRTRTRGAEGRNDSQQDRQGRLPAGDRGWVKSTEYLTNTGQSQRPGSGLLFFGGSGFCGSVGQMKFLAWLETDRFAWSDTHLGPGAWIASDTRLARSHIENTEATQLNAIAGGERFLETLEDGVDCGFGLVARQTSPFDDIMDDVLLDQRALLGKSAGYL